MKFTTAIAVLAAAATVSATSITNTNAYRLARGLPPKPPAKRATPVSGAFNFSPCLCELLDSSFQVAKRWKPSGSPGQCSAGKQHCCESTEKAGSTHKSASLIEKLGLDIAPDVLVGLTCSSPLGALSVGGNSWYIHFENQ